MQDLYQNEHDTIVKIVSRLQVKYMDGTEVTLPKLNRMHEELTGRLEDAGFDVLVDVTPLLDGQSPSVTIVGRKEKLEGFDYEKKKSEVLRRIKRKEKDPGIEGVV